MRRFVLAALAGTLVLSSCSNDQSPSAPTEPGPEASVARCRPPTPFPIADLTKKIIKIFPVQGGLQAQALIREVAIGILWTACKPIDAQKGVASFVKWMVQQFQANKLIGGKSAASSDRVIALTNALYSAVGLTPPNFPPEVVGDGNNFGNGLFVPGTQAVIKTGNNEGGTVIPPNGFDQPTLITIFLKPTSGFDSPPQAVFAPFFEITASNASGTHYLTAGQLAVVGFCADADFLEGLANPAIAHQAVSEGEGNPGGFEILDDATAAQYASLGLSCPQAPLRIGALDMGSFKGFAMSAWQQAAHYARPVVESWLLPEKLQATSAMVTGKSGLGGLARSLSPFAVTDRDRISPISCSQEGTIKSLNSDTPVDVTFSNQTEQSVSVFWLDFNGQRNFPFEGGGIGVPYAVLAPGQSYVQGTFVTHPWILIGDAGGEDETCYGIFLPLPDGGTVIVP